MSSGKGTRDRTREREERSSKVRNERERKESDRKEKKSTKEREKERTDRKIESKDKHKDRERREREEKESDRKRSKAREREREEKKKTEIRKPERKETSKVERKSSKKEEIKKEHVEQHLIEDLIDDDGDLVESEISEENIKAPSRINQIQSARVKDVEEEYNYDDDDFEDYDEDFEEDDEEEEEEEEDESSEEERVFEKKLDSGNYDVQISKQTSIRMQKELEAVKEAMKRENSSVRGKKNKTSSEDSGRESPPSPARQERKQSGFINFSAAKERNKIQLASAAATSRGSELLQMIRLDIVSFDLLDLPPIR